MDFVLIIVIGVGLTVALLVYGATAVVTRRREIVDERVETFAGIEEQAAAATAKELHPTTSVAGLVDLLMGRKYLQRLEEDLVQADIPMLPSEYVLTRLVLAGVGLIMSLFIMTELKNTSLEAIRACALGMAGFFTPAMMVKYRQNKRRDKFVAQLADALLLLTNSLRSGYSFLKGLELVAQETGDPISKELHRMLREVNLGATIEQAMLNLGKRMNSEDLNIVISAYLVQKDVGGNLTEIMDKVAETIRERLKIQGDIRVLTAQGRLSGFVVGLTPVALFLFFMFNSRDYFDPMFRPPLIGILPGIELPVGVVMLLGALFWQMLGGYIIYKIIKIKV